MYAYKLALVVKNLPANAGDRRDTGSIPGSGRSPGEGLFLPGESHGQRSLTSYSPRGRKESNMTEHSCTLYLTLDRGVVLEGEMLWQTLDCTDCFIHTKEYIPSEGT